LDWCHPGTDNYDHLLKCYLGSDMHKIQKSFQNYNYGASRERGSEARKRDLLGGEKGSATIQQYNNYQIDRAVMPNAAACVPMCQEKTEINSIPQQLFFSTYTSEFYR
jgi:hypothetical protein